MDVLQQLVDMVKDMPSLAIWVLAGLLMYKIVMIGSWFGIARLVILKGHECIVKPRKKEYLFGSHFIGGAGIANEFLGLIASIKNSNGSSYVSEYVHDGDLSWFREAINDKKLKDKK